MEGKSSAGGNMVTGGTFGFIDLQGSMQLHHQQNHHLYQQGGSIVQPQIQDVFPFRVRNVLESTQPVSFPDYNKGERGKNSASDDDSFNYIEQGIDGNNEVGKGKKVSPWQRVKWTEKMVKLLITAVSYLGEDSSSDSASGGRRKSVPLLKKGKWKCISKVMDERGFHVSPQQCEDKFNDLNKRYKRLNEILGRGTSCKVVEYPKLLDVMELSEKAKEDVRKILSSKHLFYEEMCSYHNANRLFLPHDPDLQRSLQLVLGSKDDFDPNESKRYKVEDFDEEDQDAEADDGDDETEENGGQFGFPEVSTKRLKQRDKSEDAAFRSTLNFLDRNRILDAHLKNDHADVHHICPEGRWKQRMKFHWFQLEEQKLQIKAQMLELEEQRFKWQKINRIKDRELDKMRLENENMKLENDRMALELKHKEINSDYN